jgi:hypothetical protein
VCVKVTFEDVKGCDEAKQELQEVVEFLMNPDKFSALGTCTILRCGIIEKFFFIFFGGLECVGHSFAYVAHS